MESSTKILRRMLDERGVEWTYEDGTVSFNDGKRWFHAWAYNDGAMCVSMGYLTPEQAIAATLGAGTCKRVMDSIDPFAMWVCDHCGHPLDTSENFCGGCGRKVVEPTTNGVDAEVEQ